MDGTTLGARIAWAYGKAAGKIGLPYTQYRPASATAPMAIALGTVTAAFKPSGKDFGAPRKPENAFFDGHMDTSPVAPGDILVGPEGTFFVWQLPPFGAALCVECNYTVSVVRPDQPVASGFNDLGATASTTQITLLSGWPASIRRDGRGQESDADLPGTGKVGNWVVLLPAFPSVTILVADVVARSGDAARLLVSLAELTDGWRLIAQEEST
jgi:hypothetical protein